MTLQQLQMISVKAMAVQIEAMGSIEPVLPQPDYSRLALANGMLCRQENDEQMRRRRERDAREQLARDEAFLLTNGIPVIWAVRNLRSVR